MKIKMNLTICGLDGTPFTENDKPIVLAQLCSAALLATYQSEGELSGEEKFKRYEIASKLYSTDEPDLTAEEVAKVKQLIGKLYSPALVGPAFLALEGRIKEPTPIRPAKKASQ